MTLDDIAPDITLTLTEEHLRLFRAAGCKPACHSCGEDIVVGDPFKLATYKDYRTKELRDVMLCDNCTVDNLKRRMARYRKNRIADRQARGLSGYGFSRPSLTCLD